MIDITATVVEVALVAFLVWVFVALCRIPTVTENSEEPK